MDYQILKNAIAETIKQNGNQEITGNLLQGVLLSMINSLGAGYQFGGVVNQAVIPRASDPKFFYLAAAPGTYSNFGNLKAEVGELTIFFKPQGSNAWYKQSCKIVDIVDNLVTEDANKALSANQGVFLNQKINSVSDKLDSIYSIDYLTKVSGSAVSLLDPAITLAEFVFQISGSKRDGAALINSIKGKTLAWNQLLDIVSGSGSVNGISYSINNGIITLNGTATAIAPITISVNSFGIPFGHKVLFSISKDLNLGPFSLILHNGWEISADLSSGSEIVESISAVPGYCTLRIDEGVSFTNDSFYLGIFDLTLLGIDNLTTVEEVEAWLATNVGFRSYYPYNAGELKSNDAQSIVTEGRNQWDEEWVPGTLSGADGSLITPFPNRIASKNFCPCLPNTAYYAHFIGNTYSSYVKLFWYDEHKNYISTEVSDGVKISPVNACYFKMTTEGSDYGEVYRNDICINLSDASFNGQYEPYWKNTLELNIKTLTGKKDGQGASVTIFPDGACGVGSVYDELRKSVAYKRCGIVDLGDLSWIGQNAVNGIFRAAVAGMKQTSNTIVGKTSKYAPSRYGDGNTIYYATEDMVFVTNGGYTGGDGLLAIRDSSFANYTVSQVAAALTGVKFIFELATPETYVLDTPQNMTYKVAKGGTEKRISPNADGISAPMVEEVQYPLAVAVTAPFGLETDEGNPGFVKLYVPEDATGAVFISCGGKAYTGIIGGGAVTVLISGLSAGTYPFTLFYTGDSKYASAVINNTITIS